MALPNKSYSSIFEAANDGMAIHDLETGQVIDVNQKHAELFGFTAEELRAGGIDLISPGEPPYTGEDALRYVKKAASGTPQFFEWKAKNKAGHFFWAEVSLKRAEIDGKNQVLAISRDVTERKKNEDALRYSREQLRRLASHMELVREEERKRIAREIHDELGQSLTGLRMDISFLNKRISRNQKKLIFKTDTMIALVDSTIKTVQRISRELRPGLLDDLGLYAAMEWQTQDFQERTGIHCELNSLGIKDVELPQDFATAIFRIFQEALTNISRHSKATKAEVILTIGRKNVLLEVNDNGIGIDNRAIADSQSFGLLGIRERASFRNGDFSVHGVKNKGTMLKVKLPIDEPAS
jgi:PAS domain S-box-containing protein